MEAVLQGPFGRTVLGLNVINIGRASDNQLVVKDQTTSSHHAEIRPGAYGYSLSDLSSTNGTFVNER
jgi:pSer/pThr/pTyr-binding forkhead associated (FHA) protein